MSNSYKINIQLSYETESETESDALQEATMIVKKHISTVIFDVDSIKAKLIDNTKCILCNEVKELKGGICKECFANFNEKYDRENKPQ